MKGMQAGVAAVICNVVIDMGGKIVKDNSLLSTALMVGVFVSVYFFKVSIILVILCCGLIGFISGTISARRKRSAAGLEGGERK